MSTGIFLCVILTLFALSKADQACSPGEPFVGCLGCRCSADGSWPCSATSCAQPYFLSEQYNSSSSSSAQLPKTKVRSCRPGELQQTGCNACWCASDGSRWTCTVNTCNNYNANHNNQNSNNYNQNYNANGGRPADNTNMNYNSNDYSYSQNYNSRPDVNNNLNYNSNNYNQNYNANKYPATSSSSNNMNDNSISNYNQNSHNAVSRPDVNNYNMNYNSNNYNQNYNGNNRPTPSYPQSYATNQLCSPGQSVPSGDGYCKCSADGTSWACSASVGFGANDRRPQPQCGTSTCSPGEIQPSGCNTCTCAPDGSRWSCTSFNCPQGFIQNNEKPVISG